MFKIVMTICACTLLGLSLPQIDGGYLYIARFALGSFILASIITNET